MDNEIIFSKVKNILEGLGIETNNMNMSSDFEADLGLDSLDYIELILALEEEFHRDISDLQILKTVRGAVEYIRGRLDE